jgi:hypothetical protein
MGLVVSNSGVRMAGLSQFVLEEPPLPYSFEPPSTGILAPVNQRAPSVSDQSLNGSFGRGVSKNRRVFEARITHPVRATREEMTMMFEPSPSTGRSCWTRKNGLRTFVAKIGRSVDF